MSENAENWHPGQEGAGPSGDLETKEQRTEPEPRAEEPVREGSRGAAGAGGPSGEDPKP